MKLVYNYRKKADHLFKKWVNMIFKNCFGNIPVDSDWFIIRINGLTIISLAHFSIVVSVFNKRFYYLIVLLLFKC